MSSSVHIDNKKKYILVLGKGSTQGLEYALTAEKDVFHYFYCYRNKIVLKFTLQWGK